jgi:hypothetical protein
MGMGRKLRCISKPGNRIMVGLKQEISNLQIYII